MESACAFIGGSNIKINDELEEQTRNIIAKCIADGYSNFYFGCYGNWTILCGSILRSLQKMRVNVYSYCFIPDLPYSDNYLEELIELTFFDEVKVLTHKNIVETQLYIINSADRIVAIAEDKAFNSQLLSAVRSGVKELIII